MKICNWCELLKDIKDFANDRSRSDGRRGTCKACDVIRTQEWRHADGVRLQTYERRRTLKIYGLSIEDYARLLEAQHGACAICKTVTPGGRWDTFNVDHDHTTGRVRGLLCYRCNLTIGKMNDDPGLLRLAADYLETALTASLREQINEGELAA